MAIPTTIESLSTTANSNGPAAGEAVSDGDDGLRQAYAFIRQLVTQGSDIVSASTITPPSTGSLFDITGTTAITTIASTNSWDGRVIALQFDGILTLTHSSNLYLPGAANITTAAGDIALLVQRGTGAWQLLSYMVKADNRVVQGTFAVKGNVTLGDAGGDTVTTNGNVSISAPTSGVALTVSGVGGGSGIAINTVGPAATLNIALSSSGSTTAATVVQLTNTTGVSYLGTESSTGGSLASGSGAYSTVVSSNAATSLHLGTNGAVRQTINSTGNVTISAPSSGTSLAVTAVAGALAADFTAGPIKTRATTVAGLLAAATAGAGARDFVTDANATTFASVVAGGGANGVPVYSDGAAWRIG